MKKPGQYKIGRTEYHKLYQAANKEKIAAKSKEYRIANKEELTRKQKLRYDANRIEILAKKKPYHEAHKEERKEYARVYHQVNKEKIILKVTAWQKANPDKTAATRAKYKLNNPIGNRARDIVQIAKTSKKLLRQPCEVCGKIKADAHHDNYSKPLELRWLCRLHHKQYHILRTDLLLTINKFK